MTTTKKKHSDGPTLLMAKSLVDWSIHVFLVSMVSKAVFTVSVISVTW